jgi:hypothetical protein
MNVDHLQERLAVEVKRAIAAVPPEAVMPVCQLVHQAMHGAGSNDSGAWATAVLALVAMSKIYDGCKGLADFLMSMDTDERVQSIRQAIAGKK